LAKIKVIYYHLFFCLLHSLRSNGRIVLPDDLCFIDGFEFQFWKLFQLLPKSQNFPEIR
jgi:hypothetical protein